MCQECGCGKVERFGVEPLQAPPEKPPRLVGEPAAVHEHEHTHADGTTHRHAHAHPSTPAHEAANAHAHAHGIVHTHPHTHADGTTDVHPHAHEDDKDHGGAQVHQHAHGPALHHTHEHTHADGTTHRHPHEHAEGVPHETSNAHEHAHSSAQRTTIEVNQAILSRNERLAERNRGFLQAKGVVAVNVLSSPGSGKTTLIEKTVAALGAQCPLAVIVGDLATANDARRIKAAGAPVVQITTGTVCHLDAEMVARGLEQLDLDQRQLLVVENVGNLVCPADFDLGETARVVLVSVTEGEDKPLKYPPMFKSAQVVVITKMDLAEVAGCDLDQLRQNIRGVAPQARVLELSARTGDGLEAWFQYLRTLARR